MNFNPMKKYCFFSFFLLLTTLTFGQTLVNQKYNQNLFAINPAFVGIRGGLATTVILDNQFNGTTRPLQTGKIFFIENAVSTKKFPNDSLRNVFYEKQKMNEIEAERTESKEASEVADIPYERVNKYNFGLIGFNGNGSVNISTGLTGAFSYRYSLSHGRALLLGLQVGFNYIPIFNATAGNQFFPNFGIGSVLVLDKSFIGLSIPNFISKKDAFGINSSQIVSLQGGYSLENGDISINPFGQISLYDFKDIGAEINLKAWYKQKYAGGVGLFKNTNGLGYVLMAEYQFAKSTRVGLLFNPKPFGSTNNQNFRNSPAVNLMVKFTLKPSEQNIFSSF
jgi:Type IX secretion system membrane protein PorP/SprF